MTQQESKIDASLLLKHLCTFRGVWAGITYHVCLLPKHQVSQTFPRLQPQIAHLIHLSVGKVIFPCLSHSDSNVLKGRERERETWGIEKTSKESYYNPVASFPSCLLDCWHAVIAVWMHQIRLHWISINHTSTLSHYDSNSMPRQATEILFSTQPGPTSFGAFRIGTRVTKWMCYAGCGNGEVSS